MTQRLAVLAIEASRAEMAASGLATGAVMKAVREGLIRLSEDIHSLAYQLHPSVLYELGLVEALRAECERRSRRSGVAVSHDLGNGARTIDRDIALCLYRVAQEALGNVVRHANAGTAEITLRQVDRGLQLAIRDNGIGFVPGAPKGRPSLGLANMRERLRLVNGTLDIDSAPGQGTVVLAWVPLEGDAS